MCETEFFGVRSGLIPGLILEKRLFQNKVMKESPHVVPLHRQWHEGHSDNWVALLQGPSVHHGRQGYLRAEGSCIMTCLPQNIPKVILNGVAVRKLCKVVCQASAKCGRCEEALHHSDEQAALVVDDRNVARLISGIVDCDAQRFGGLKGIQIEDLSSKYQIGFPRSPCACGLSFCWTVATPAAQDH